MCSVNSTGAENKPADKPKDIEKHKIKTVHIRVFFDGTSNNAVQTSLYAKIKADRKPAGYESETARELISKLKELDLQKKLSRNPKAYRDAYNREPDPGELAKEINKTAAKLRELNLHPELDLERMHGNTDSGYSNVAVLYSLLADRHDTDDTLYYDLYVEGSGANDITHLVNGDPDNPGFGNPNGLGFGLGDTGVTALVSKAVDSVYRYLIGYAHRFDSATMFKFYLFGFSRGATCARLFAELTTRDENETLPRESEFGQPSSYACKRFTGSRLPFMEKDFLDKKCQIDRANVTVEVLGIYDTVGSIGNLKQKDGWVNKLTWLYRPWWWNNYHGNFHYMNVWDYGLYSPHNERVRKTCHICAADEFRENFALVTLGTHIKENMTEIIIPGCHSDVGGGYVDAIGMDASIDMRHPRRSMRTVPAKLFLKDPSTTGSETGELNEKTLNRLGWISTRSYPDFRSFGQTGSDGRPYTLRYVENGKKLSVVGTLTGLRPIRDSHTVKIKRFEHGGYSNIPLKMMLQFVETHVKDDTGKSIFNDSNNPYGIHDSLKPLADRLVASIESGKTMGRRVWCIPDGGYSGDYYRWLRLNYLHLSGSNLVVHTRMAYRDEEGMPFKAETNWGNIGNFINYDPEGRICRIIYSGDKSRYSDNYADNVNYMYNLTDCEVCSIPVAACR